MTSPVIQISRSLKTQSELYESYGKEKAPPKKIIHKIRDSCSLRSTALFILSLFPVIKTIKTYKLQYIRDDIISGISAACLHFPQGLAYGMLASLSPAYGLYSSFFPVLIYVIFGSSHHVSFGTNAVIAIFVAEMANVELSKLPQSSTPIPTTTIGYMNASLSTYYGNSSLSKNLTTIAAAKASGNVAFKASVAAGSSLIIGIFLIGMGLCRLGFITSYMSNTFISAFAAVGAIHIISSQIPNFLGIKIPSFNKPGKLIYHYIEIFKAVPNIHGPTVIVSVICMIILILVKDVINEKCKHRMKMPVPIDVILVIAGTIISKFGQLNKTYRIDVVGEIPMGLPAPSLPYITADIVGDSIVIAIIIFVLAISMVRICEAKHDYVVDDNQELIAYGMANLGSSFFACFASSLSPPRTLLLSTMGAKTVMNGLVSAIVVLVIILFVGEYLQEVPKSVLAAMIIIAVKNLVAQIKEMPGYWRVNRYDFIIYFGTLLSGVLMDIPYALYFGVLLCLLTVVIQSQNSATYSIAQAGNEDRLLDSKIYDVLGFKNPKIAIFRMESSLYFATADRFKRKLYTCTLNPKTFRRIPRDDVEIVVKHNAGYVPDEMTPPSIANMDNDIPHGKMFYSNADIEGKAYRRTDPTTSPSDLNANDKNQHGKKSFPNGNVDDESLHEKSNSDAHVIEETTRETTSGSAVNIDIVRDNYGSAPPLTHVIIDCASVNYIDLNGAKLLAQIVYEFKEIGITVLFGNCTNYMRNYIDVSTLKDKIEKKCIYADILDAYYAASRH